VDFDENMDAAALAAALTDAVYGVARHRQLPRAVTSEWTDEMREEVRRGARFSALQAVTSRYHAARKLDWDDPNLPGRLEDLAQACIDAAEILRLEINER
jgi:hypothetical protein